MAELWYRAQPSLDTFALLRRVASHVFGRTGGAVLNGIEEVMQRTGLASAQALRLGRTPRGQCWAAFRCEFLLQKAARPYFEMVSLWVYEGRLSDPFGEFCVRQRAREELRRQGPAADFWQKHFTLAGATT